jgi:hypothetical protein
MRKDLVYENGVALYAINSYSPNWERYDTLFLQFNSDGLISRKMNNWEINTYTYNSDKRLEMIVDTHIDSYKLDRVDTTLLEWDSRGNMVKIIFMEGPYDRIVTILYDDKPNYHKTLHIPYEMEILSADNGLDYMSANNYTNVKSEIHGTSDFNHTYILRYNEIGYPELINTDTDEVKLFYTY